MAEAIPDTLTEVSPDFVCGSYAPPANVCPHFLHVQIPTPTLFKNPLAQLGHLYLSLLLVITSTERLLSVNPYLTPRAPDGFLLAKLVLPTVHGSAYLLGLLPTYVKHIEYLGV